MFCKICKKEKTRGEMSKTKKIKSGCKNYCKQCASNSEKNRRDKLSKQQKKEISKNNYSKILNKVKEDPDYAVRYWCSRWVNAKRTGQYVEGRKNIDIDILIQKCKNSLIDFPYLVFSNGKEKWETPSVDRIDSSKPYSNDNIQVIPLWLNSAKLNMPESKLRELMKLYLEQ